MLSDINLYGSAVGNVRNRHSTLQVQVQTPLGSCETGAGSTMDTNGLRVIEKIDCKLHVKKMEAAAE